MFNWLKSWGRKTAASVRKSFGLGVRAALGGQLPGAWASDHREEANHFIGWTYIAVHAAAMQAAKAVVEVYDDKQRPEAKTRRKALRNQHGTLAKARLFERDRLARSKSVAKSSYGQDKPHDDEIEPLPADHPLVKLLKHPNPFESGAMFRYRQRQQLRLTGTCYIWNVPGKNVKETVQRYVMPTATVVPQMPSPQFPLGSYRIIPAVSRYYQQIDPDGFTEFPGWYRMVGATIPAEQVQLIRFPHPIRLDDGMSPLSAGAAWLDAAKEIDTARFQQLRNGPMIGAQLELPEDVEYGPDELDAIAAKINAKYAGPENTGKWMVTNAGGKINPMTAITPEEMRYVESFDQMKAASLALHQTPPVAVGIQEAGAYAAYNASLRQYRDVATQPDLDLMAESDTEHLAPQFGDGLTIEIEAEEVHDIDLEIRQDQLKEQQYQLDARIGLRTFDEWRELRGLPPVGGAKGAEFVGGMQAPQPGMDGNGQPGQPGQNGERQNPLDALDRLMKPPGAMPSPPEDRFGTKTFRAAMRPFMHAKE